MSELLLAFQTIPAAWIGACTVLGLLVGSFLNVVIYRLPVILEREWRGQCRELLEIESGEEAAASFSLVSPRSRCPHCEAPIKAWQNIPVISYLFLRGRCANCSARISPRYPLIEAVSGLLAGYVAWHFGFGWQAAAGMLFAWSLLALTMIDYDTQLLPDNITLPLLWLGLILSLENTFVAPREAIVGAVAGYLSLWLVFHGFKLLTGKEGMGYGDFKLFAALGAWMGWKMLPMIILLASGVGAVVGGLMIVLQRHGRGQPIPFGPFLAAAGLIAFFWGHDILAWYLGLYRHP